MNPRIGRTPARDVVLFVLPSFLGFALFILVPAALSVLFSFTKYSGGRLSSIRFIGLDNYLAAFRSEQFWRSMSVTLQFVAGSVVLLLAISLLFALCVNRPLAGRTFFRGVLFLPNMLSVVAISLAFAMMMHPDKGLLNQLLRSLNLPESQWLASRKSALPSIIAIFIWQNAGYYMMIFLSGLQGIGKANYEAADIEGASGFQKLVLITLPMLSPVIFLTVILAVIRSFNVFGHVFVLTGGQDGGGPSGSTSVIVFDIYKNAFHFFRMGYASAEAVILLIIVLAITVIQYRKQNEWVSYDAV